MKADEKAEKLKNIDPNRKQARVFFPANAFALWGVLPKKPKKER